MSEPIIQGYTLQPLENIDMVNNNKIIEEELLRVLDGLQKLDAVDQRWLAIGRTHIEQGFMAINRAIFRPRRLSDEDLGY
jgi:hypothetical protein